MCIGIVSSSATRKNQSHASHGYFTRPSVQRALQEIHPNSPAGAAGLRSHSDYIIGTADAILHDQSDFYYVIGQHNKRPLRLYVYNSEDDSCRETTIVPDSTWGGEGRCAPVMMAGACGHAPVAMFQNDHHLQCQT